MLRRLWVIVAVLFAVITQGPVGWAEIRIGLALPSSEDETGSQFAKEVKQALILFKEQLDAQLGRELTQEFGVAPPRIIFETKECPPKSVKCSVEIAKEFVGSDCVAIIGHTHSEPALAAGKIYDRHNVALLTPTATQKEIARASNSVFRMTFDDQWQGSIIAAYVYRILGSKKIVVVSERSAYGIGLLESFRKQWQSMGAEPAVEVEVPNKAHESHNVWVPLISALDSAEAIVLFTSKRAALELFGVIRSKDSKIPIIGSDNLLWPDFVRSVDQKVHRLSLAEPGLMVASPFFYELAPLRAYEFKRAYERHFQQETQAMPAPEGSHSSSTIDFAPFQALFVDAALLVTRGIMGGLAKKRRSVGELREEVLKYLRSLDNPNKAVDGITGRLYFDKEGSVPRPVLFGWLKGSRFRPAYLQLATDRSPTDIACPSKEGERSSADPAKTPIMADGVLLRPRYVVYTGVNIYRIDNINLLRQTFDAEFFLWFKWTKPEKLVLDQHTIFFWNSLHTADDQLVPLGESTCEGVKYRGFRIKGSFLDIYDLRNYPFDSQWLSLRLSLSAHGASSILLAVDEDVDFAADQFKIFPGEYNHLGRPEHASGTLPLNASFGDPSRKTTGGMDYEYSVYQATFGVSRNPFPYLLRMFLPLFVLVAIALAVFWVPMEHFAVRITLVMTALLSTIVFHVSRASELPNVGYLTLADRFFVCAYVLMSFSIASNIWIEWSVKKKLQARAETLNSGARYVLVSASVIVFLTLALPAIERWYFRALVGVGLLFSLWLVYEFLKYNGPFRSHSASFWMSFWIVFPFMVSC